MDSNQQAILRTSENALQAKAAAVRAGYYDDPFLLPFVEPPASTSTALSNGPPVCMSRRPPYVQPIIKRGTHARVCCIDRVVQAFSAQVVERFEEGLDERDQNAEDEAEDEEECVVQVIVLGCGKDTVFFRNYEACTRNSAVTLRWFEVDHPPMIEEKTAVIKLHPNVFENMHVQKGEGGAYEMEPTMGVSCAMIGHDLREEGIMEKLQQAGCDTCMPALFILECVLMYLPENDSERLLRSITDTYGDAYLCLYEPVLGNDAFGNVMEGNLTRAGLATPNSSLCQTRQLRDQLAKVVHKAGWKQATACDMWNAYDTIVTAEQRQRGNRAEFLDEWEEFVLIMRHYCFLVAATGSLGENFCQISKGSPVGFSPGQADHLAKD